MSNISLKYRFLILLVFCIQIVSAQVVIDTIGKRYERVIKNNELYYTYQDASNQLIELRYTSPMSTITLNGYIRSLTGAVPVWDNYDYFLKDGQILDQTMKKVCDTDLDEIYVKVGENFIGSKKDSCFLVLDNCEVKFLTILSFDFRIELPRNCTNFFFLDIAKNILHIFDSNGNKISQIDRFKKDIREFHGNKTLIKGKFEIGSNDWITALYNYKGQLLAKGNILGENREVTILETQEGEQKYYFKDQEIPIPENILEITPFLEFVEVKLKNGNVGLLSNSLGRTIISPKYKVFGHSGNYSSDDLYPSCWKREVDGFIYALDSKKKLAIFNSEGEEIKLDIDIYFSALRNSDPFKIMKLKDNLSFYVIHNRRDNIFYVFDKEWNFIATEKRKSTDYYFLSAVNRGWSLVPISVLEHFREKINKDDFFRVQGTNSGRNNIIDSDLQLVYKNDVGTLTKINKNHFILKDGIHYNRGDKNLIKLSKQ